MEDLLNAISLVGFPIVAYGAMFWYMVKLNDNHKSELATIRASLDANTTALMELKSLVQYVVNPPIQNDAE